MYHVNDYAHNVSLKLSEVMDDIGVNERMVTKRRRVVMLIETMKTITDKFIGYNTKIYHPGSQSEGTTTLGLKSDLDILVCHYDYNVMQDLAEWLHGKVNLLMIQDKDTAPGYCFLQAFRKDVPLPLTEIPDEHFIKDTRGRVLWKNSIVNATLQEGSEQHGPSEAMQGQNGNCDRDLVSAFCCTSWPQSAAGWLDRQGLGRWPTPDIKRYAVRNGCCVVPVGSKVSMNPEIEWRISTTLAERCLMFNLNITQIRCYVLMKMILKSYLNCQGESCLSSFMCKTTLLHCIENIESKLWQERNLFICLTYCLLQLYNFLLNEECPHFIINENNLMAGQFSAEKKRELLERIKCLIQRDGLGLLGIQIDDLGEKLNIKLNMIPQLVHYLSPGEINETVSGVLYYNFATTLNTCHKQISKSNQHKETTLLYVCRMMKYSKEGNILEQTASRFLAPQLYTTLGSVLASANIGSTNTVSPEALVWFSAGLNSDGLPSRLKLASAFYCSGDVERAEFILRHIKRQYDNGVVVPVCGCYIGTPPTLGAEFCRICNEQNEEVIQQNVAFCIRFLQSEINCVPRELQYEMFKSSQNDMLQRDHSVDYYMDWAVVVDSLPYLYFLQYRTSGFLHRYQDQQQALRNLVWTIEVEPDLRHRETALNLLGECMEQENRPQNALQCYMLSLQQRPRNNAARLHICRLLANIK